MKEQIRRERSRAFPLSPHVVLALDCDPPQVLYGRYQSYTVVYTSMLRRRICTTSSSLGVPVYLREELLAILYFLPYIFVPPMGIVPRTQNTCMYVMCEIDIVTGFRLPSSLHEYMSIHGTYHTC